MTQSFANAEAASTIRSKLNSHLLSRFIITHPDYGAVAGGGSGDADTNRDAIQAAVNAAVAAGGGRVIIPRGEYYVSQSTHIAINPGGIGLGAYNQLWDNTYTYSTKYIVYTDEAVYKSAQNSNTGHDPDTDDGTWWTPVPAGTPYDTCYVIIEGEGTGSYVRGNFAGFIFDRCCHNGQPQHIVIQNLKITNAYASAGGCIRLLGVDGSEVANCDLQGCVGVQIGGNFDGIVLPDGTGEASPYATAGTSFTSTVRNCTMIGPIADASQAGSCGVIMGMHTECYQNSITVFQHGIRAYGVGSCIHGNRLEKNDAAIFLGQDGTGGTATAKGYHVFGNATEGNRDAFYINDCTHSVFSGNVLTDGSQAISGVDNRSQLRLYSCSHLTFISCAFGDVSLTKAAVWREGNLGGPVTFINCSTDSFVQEAGISNQYVHLLRYENCDGNWPGGRFGVVLTYAQLPDNSTFFPHHGDFFTASGIEKEGGTAITATGDYIEAAEGGGDEQAALVMWNAYTSKYQVVVLTPTS
jgi:hypothetical protein